MPLIACQNKFQAFKPKLKKNRRKLSTSASAALESDKVDSCIHFTLVRRVERLKTHTNPGLKKLLRLKDFGAVAVLGPGNPHHLVQILFRCFQRFFFKDFVQRLFSNNSVQRFVSNSISKDFAQAYFETFSQSFS